MEGFDRSRVFLQKLLEMGLQLRISIFEQPLKICHCLLVRSKVRLPEFRESFVHALDGAEKGSQAGFFRARYPLVFQANQCGKMLTLSE